MNQLDFNTVLAISIHDMKNSLSRVLAAFDAILDIETGQCQCDASTVAQLQYEARRVNDNLMQLLTLYRSENGLYTARFATTNLFDLLENAWLQNKPTMDHRGVECQIDADEGLEWTLDHALIAALIENILNNTVRYTRARIRLAAWIENNRLRILVEDDGPGYPPAMLGLRTLDVSGNIDRRLGRTGLGLHFCALVADCHADGDQRGWIELTNGGILGGGRFLVVLPAIAPNAP